MMTASILRCLGAPLRIILAVLVGTSSARSAECDLPAISPTTYHDDSFPLGSENVQTRTFLVFTFDSNPSGSVKITRSDNTFLLNFGDAIASQISSLNNSLPKNECNTSAAVSSQNTDAVPPNYVISVKVNASQWICTPVPPYPCSSYRERVPRMGSSSYLAQDNAIKQETSPLITRIDFWHQVAPLVFPIPPTPVPVPSPVPLPPLINSPIKVPLPPIPGVKLCDRLKTVLGSGSVSATFVLSVEVQNDTASITSSKDIHTQLDAKTQFLLALLGGPAFGWFSGLAIEKQLQSLTNKNLALLPTQIALPNGEEQVLVWKTTGAQFNRTIYNGKATPVLSVIREFNIESPAACVLHKEIQKMQIQ